MIFNELEIPGIYLIELDRYEDERGFFARSFCKNEFLAKGLHADFVQCNLSYNKKRGTLRGMHYQSPYEEVKLVTCTAGRVYDVLLDIRQNSASYGRWLGVELSAKKYNTVYIPAGIAHGFQTLADNSSVFYQMGEFYHQECAQGIRWNDERFAIDWPVDRPIISRRDQSW